MNTPASKSPVSQYFNPTVAGTCEILDRLASETEPVSVTDFAASTRLTRGTALRVMRTLTEIGIAKGASGAKYVGHWGARFRDITDGTAQVIAMGEIIPSKGSHHHNGWMHFNSLWTGTSAPINYPIFGLWESGYRPASTDCHDWRNYQTSQGFKSMHKGGAQFVFADGSVHLLAETIDYLTYQRLGCRRDGEPVGAGFEP